MFDELLRFIVFFLGIAFAIFAPMFLLPIINDCFLGWFGTEGCLQLSTKWKIAATVSCSFITMLVTFFSVRHISYPQSACIHLVFLWLAFSWCVLIGMVYYIIIL